MILEKNIEELQLNNKIINKLKEKDIRIIKDLWKMKRKELKQLGFSDSEISQIIIKLQLHAIDLNKRVY
ncbi:MAG: hypothetical protein IJ568_02605 [Bacilli bacterium]|jgi:DNA-directed RNA polymerase alpha subunit|nr:hypothetical protein [Bacilli bacterium]